MFLVQAAAQGTLWFSNLPAAVPGGGAPVYDVCGCNGLEGPLYVAQLYAGNNDWTLTPVGPPVPFMTGTRAGFFSDPTARVIPNALPQTPVEVEVRVWAITDGATYEDALAHGGLTGASAPIHVYLGGSGEPPGLPSSLIGLTSFTLFNPLDFALEGYGPRCTCVEWAPTVAGPYTTDHSANVGFDGTIVIPIPTDSVRFYRLRAHSRPPQSATLLRARLGNGVLILNY